jgi:Flavodoxin domain
MTVLVTAASKHGATLEIAEAIARVLAEQGVSAELVPIDEVSDLGRYDAVVLGSAAAGLVRGLRARAVHGRAGQVQRVDGGVGATSFALRGRARLEFDREQVGRSASFSCALRVCCARAGSGVFLELSMADARHAGRLCSTPACARSLPVTLDGVAVGPKGEVDFRSNAKLSG